MATYEFKLPDIGEGIQEGEIAKWHIGEGDEIKEDDVLLEVQNDKAMVELPSPVDGKVKEIKVEEGTVSEVGDVLVTFEVEGEGNVSDDGDSDDAGEKEASADAGVAKEAVSEESEAKETTTPQPTDRKVLATPGTRKLARELGVDISQVEGTGRHGQVTRENIRQFAEQGPVKSEQPTTDEAKPAAAVSQDENLEERVPLKGVRKVIADAMVHSKSTAPHVTLMDEVDVSKLVALRKEAKPVAEERGTKLSYLPFIVKALIGGLRRYPVLNASVDDEKEEIVYKKYYHIGIAVDTDQGLMVPVIFNGERKNVWTIADEIYDLASRGREGKLKPEEMKGSTVSITNIGSVGGMFFTPVINHPEVAILGTGRISEKPVVKDGEVQPAPVMALSLSFDHRIVDGATAQEFLNYMKKLLENPQLLVMEV